MSGDIELDGHTIPAVFGFRDQRYTVCSCGERFEGRTIAEVEDLHRQHCDRIHDALVAPLRRDAARRGLGAGSEGGGVMAAIISREFTDPVTGRDCTLHVAPGEDFWFAAKVQHPDCTGLADVSADLDCFYCTVCRWSGRVSGAWVLDLYQNGRNEVTR